ncbi:hypothetical protein TNCV_1962971 [Trichonephila clavipes]|nr:hypothetical protein TNCV_1962971 [Trichonephila clavipes]
MSSMCLALSTIKIRTNHTREKVNIGHQVLIPMPYSSYSASFKDREVWVAIHRDGCLDHQDSAVLTVTIVMGGSGSLVLSI